MIRNRYYFFDFSIRQKNKSIFLPSIPPTYIFAHCFHKANIPTLPRTTPPHRYDLIYAHLLKEFPDSGASLSCNTSDSLSIALNIIWILKEHPFHTPHFFQAPAHPLFLSRQSSQRQRQCLLLPACLLCCSLYSKHAPETSLQLPYDLHATNLEVFVANLSIAFKAQNCHLPFCWLLANPFFLPGSSPVSIRLARTPLGPSFSSLMTHLCHFQDFKHYL